MIEVRRLGHATLTTPDLERQVAYYSDVLGLIVVERDKKRAFLASKHGLEAIALERGEPSAVAAGVPGRAREPTCRCDARAGASTASRASAATASRRASPRRSSSPTPRAR